MKEVERPAIVHEHLDLENIACNIKEAFVLGQDHAKKGAQQYALIGSLLVKAKAAVGHGGWMDWIKKNAPFGIDRAAKYMKLSNSSPTMNLDDQWNIISGNATKQELQNGIQTSPTSQAEIETVVINPPQKPGAWPDENRCRDCRMANRNDAKCKQCIEKNKASDREPGEEPDFSNTSPMPKNPPRQRKAHSDNGKPLHDPTATKAAFGTLMRQIDDFGVAFGCKETPTANGLRRLLGEFRDGYKRWLKSIGKMECDL